VRPVPARPLNVGPLGISMNDRILDALRKEIEAERVRPLGIAGTERRCATEVRAPEADPA
jgi:hypothetical protein